MYFYLLKIPNKIPSFVVLGLQLTVQWSKVYLRNRTHGSIKHVMITLDVKILGFQTTIKKWLHNAILWSRFSGIAKGGTLPGVPDPPLGYSMGYNFKRNEILAVKKNEKKINLKKASNSISRVAYEYYQDDHTLYEAPVCIQAFKVGFSTLLVSIVFSCML